GTLGKLTDVARDFDRGGLFGLAEFIDRLGELVRDQPREEQAATLPENADVVRLMSIHQAKGLEFPVVVVPDLGAAVGSPHQPVARWDREFGCLARPPAEDDPPPFGDLGYRLGEGGEALADLPQDLRIFYVAWTRAQDCLVLSASLPEPFRPTNAWTGLLAERFDIRTGDCITTDAPPNAGARVVTLAPLPSPPAPNRLVVSRDAPPP